ncbi:unnamed protein product [Adineta steineri]|uniref:Uncharacterized protein n=1 Tax=Adineta steineri TaxID=433720 RepID=A0A815SLR7_9BILA|nr:unnamed protein product [Adineta steineri]
MSNSFIGSKIAIITKSQCRYTGTIIGIDAQASSILLGNVKCFGTENRGGSFSNNQMPGTTVPIMQFANSDIEDLKIVDEEQQAAENSSQKQQQQQSLHSMPVLSSPPASMPKKQSSIHDDPAIVSAVVSSSNKDLSNSNRLLHDLHHLGISDDHSKKLPKTEESRLRTDSGELGPSWSLLSSSKWDNNKSHSQQQQPHQQSSNKSKFFDDFSLNNTDQLQSNHSHQQWPSNTHSTQTSRHQNAPFNEQEDDSSLPVRQPFFSTDTRSFSHELQPQNRYQNGNMQNQQRPFYNNNNNNNNNRRPPMNHQQYQQQQQRRPGGGNRETFHDNGNSYENDFDFETSNRKFNKIVSEDELKQQPESPNHFLHLNNSPSLNAEFEPIYDKRKSFFDNIAPEDSADPSAPMYNRSRNQDTFGNDRFQRQRGRGAAGGGGGYRRSNNNNYRQQQGNEDFYYRQNNNGYNYRY